MGWGSDMFSSPKSKSDTQMVSTLDKYAQALRGELGPWFEARVGQGLPSFGPSTMLKEGEEWGWIPGLTPLDQRAKGLMSEYGAEPLDMSGLQTALDEGLRGISPEDAEALYMEKVMPGQRRLYEEEIMPKVSEAYTKTGSFSGSDRAQAEARSAQKWGEQQGTQMMDWIKYGMQSGRNVLAQAAQLQNYINSAPALKAGQLTAFSNQMRQLELAEMNARFTEFKRTTPELSPIIDKMLAFMGMQTMAGITSGSATGTGPGWGVINTSIEALGEVVAGAVS